MMKMKNSQLHDQIVMGPTLVELLHPHNVLVLDSVRKGWFYCPSHRNMSLKTEKKQTFSAQWSRSPGWDLSSVSSSRTSWQTSFPSSSPSPCTPLRRHLCWTTDAIMVTNTKSCDLNNFKDKNKDRWSSSMHPNAPGGRGGGVFWLNSQASHVCPCYLHPGLGIDVLPRRLATLSLTSWNRWWPEDWRRAGQTLSMCSWERLQVR